MGDQAYQFKTIAELSSMIKKGELSPVELTENLLSRIERLDPKIHAFKLICRDRAIAEAKAAEIAIRAGEDLGPLHGIPFAVKDIFDVKGLPTTAGCRLLEDNVAEADSTAVKRLTRAGMILLGKTHSVQFAFGGVGINHHHGTPKNPWKQDAYVPGGSSSGSAVAVSAGLVPMAVGSDTGGSVRIPAALCGVVGLKTTVGRIGRSGVYPLSRSLDSVGPLAHSVEDAAIVYQAMQGVDFEDETTWQVQPHYVLGRLKKGVKGIRLAFGETPFFDDIEPDIEKALKEAGEVLRSLGAHLDRMEIPEATEILTQGKRGLMLAAEACVVNKRLIDEHFDELDPVVAQRLITGKELSASEYVSISEDWRRLRINILERLRDVEAIIVPTTSIPSQPLEVVDASVETYMTYNGRFLRNTSIGNILNLCSVSVPCGFTSQGLPIGMMIYAKPFQEDLALRVAYAYEQATDWHARRPDLSWADAD